MSEATHKKEEAMKKKEYTKPQTEAMELDMPCALLDASGKFGDPATEPAHGRDLFDSEEWDVLLGSD